MKFVSKFLNLLLFIFTFCLMTVAEWGVYNLLALPTGMENTIGFISSDKSGDGIEDNVAYLDTYTFLGEDVVQSVTRKPRYLVRSWFGWDWWQNGMEWADYAVEFVVGAVVPVFAPMYEVSQVQYYYADQFDLAQTNQDARKTFDWFNENLTVYGLYDITTNIELKTLFDSVEDTYNAEKSPIDLDFRYLNQVKFKIATEEDYAANNVNAIYQKFYAKHKSYYKNSFIFVPGDLPCSGKIYKVEETKLIKITECSGIANTDGMTAKVNGDWFHANSGFMNTLYKLNKYNERHLTKVVKNGTETEINYCSYDSWANKFMDNNGNIKSSVIALYFQFFMALILSIWFVCQNPIKIKRTDGGENEIQGGYRSRMKRKNKKKE